MATVACKGHHNHKFSSKKQLTMPATATSYGAIDLGTATPKKSTKNGRKAGKKGDTSSFSSAVYHPWLRVVALISLIILIGYTLCGKSTSNSYQFNRYMSDSSKAAAQLNTDENDENFELHDENEACFYHEQHVDHFSDDDASSSTWSNRYYKSTNYFRGPGHPIFLVVGGEGALDNGMLYPFVTQHLAPRFGAAGECNFLRRVLYSFHLLFLLTTISYHFTSLLLYCFHQ
jgi:hypothetical protein